MSIRLRLTLLYSAILAFTLIVFSSALYFSQAQITYGDIKTNLVRQADGFANFGGGFSHPEPRPPSGFLPGRWTQTRDLDGNLIGSTGDLQGVTLPLSAAGLKAVQTGAGWFETAQVQDAPLLIYSRPFTTQSGATNIVQVAAPIAEREQSLNTLRVILIVGSGFVILAAFVVGWILAGAALNPIHRITRTARAIGAERNFSHRVQHLGPKDEIGELAVTFNDMLGELETAYHHLEASLDSQRRFVADASHELRTPLTTVRGNIELLRRENDVEPQERAEIWADTKDEVERLIRLVNQLLVLARADAGQPLRREPVELKSLIEDVCRQMQLSAPQRHIECRATPELKVLGNRDALKQVLVNLIDNAIVHTPATARVSLSDGEQDGRAVIRVRDGGPGIAPELLPHLFERFYRGDVSRTGRSSGLGLAIAKELVEAQEGQISVASNSGEGTTFTIWLPKS